MGTLRKQKGPHDCLQTVLSNLLGCNPMHVLPFHEYMKAYNPEIEETDTHDERYDAWLRNTNLMRITIPVTRNEEGKINLPYVSKQHIRCIGYMEEDPENGFNTTHCVLLSITNSSNINLVADPARGESRFSWDKLTHLEFIVPLPHYAL